MKKRLLVINAVVKKFLIDMFRYPTWALQMIIWPLILPLMYIFSGYGMAGPDGSGLEVFKHIAKTDNFIGYILVGNIIWMWVNTALWSFGGFLREEQMKGTLESNWICPINRFDLLIGEAIASFIGDFMAIIVSMLEYKYIYGVTFTGNIGSYILILLTFIPAVYGFALIIASIVLWAKESGATIQLVRGLVTIFCGVSYPVILLPKSMKFVSDILPFTHGINAAREIMINGKSVLASSFYKPALICFLIGIVLFLIGKLVFKVVECKVRQSGSIERF